MVSIRQLSTVGKQWDTVLSIKFLLIARTCRVIEAVNWLHYLWLHSTLWFNFRMLFLILFCFSFLVLFFFLLPTITLVGCSRKIIVQIVDRSCLAYGHTQLSERLPCFGSNLNNYVTVKNLLLYCSNSLQQVLSGIHL